MILLLDEVAKLALTHVGTREGPGNTGDAIKKYQTEVDGRAVGEPWCAGFVAYCVREIERQHKVKSPLALSEHVLTMWNANNRYQAHFPMAGLIACWRKAGTTQGHCGIVVEVSDKLDYFLTVEGNTSGGPGFEREGEGVFLKKRTLEPMGIFKFLGFICPFGQ